MAQSSVANGVLTLGIAIAALAFPEETLIGGMLIVGLLSVLFGLNHVITAASIRVGSPSWRLLLAHGVLLSTYGLLTIGGTALSFVVMLGVVLAWLVSHAALAVRIVSRTQSARWARIALLGAAVVDIGVAILILAVRPVTIFQFLFFGAAYAAVFGLSQIVTGVTLRDPRLPQSHSAPHGIAAFAPFALGKRNARPVDRRTTG